MGTSKGIPTPRGGRWPHAKREINSGLAGGTSAPDAGTAGAAGTAQNGSPAAVVSAVVSAMGGLGLGVGQPGRSGAGGGAGRGGHSGGGGGRTSGAQARRVGRAVAGLGGFGSAVQTRGLTEALRELDLGALEGRPAVEIIARVSERLAEGMDGVDGEILKIALNEAILEAAQLEEELGYTDLDQGLQAFLNDQGLGGLLELFLARLASDLVTAAIFEHVDQKSESANQTEAMLAGIESVCRNKAHTTIEQYRMGGRLNRTDWFGGAGRRLGLEMAESILTELRNS